MKKIIFIVLFSILALSGFAAEELSIIGTYTDVVNKDGKFIKKEKFESLPNAWGKNGNYYNAILIFDGKDVLAKDEWNAKIEIIKEDKTLKTINIPKTKAKKIGNKYFLTTFKNILLPAGEGPHTIKYSINSSNKNSLSHTMQIIGGD